MNGDDTLLIYLTPSKISRSRSYELSAIGGNAKEKWSQDPDEEQKSSIQD
jgi:hypothetical protein